MKKRCLIVDDDVVSREVVQFLLEEHGLAITTARNGKEATDFCKEMDFDCVIMDLEMPIMNGFEFLEQKPFSGKKTKPVIFFVSMRDYEEDKNHAINLGASEFIVKPITRNELKQKLQTHGVI